MKPQGDSRFTRRIHADKSVDSICLVCFRTVIPKGGGERGLELAERSHVCRVEDLPATKAARKKA
jgi:hypothetical protein